MSIDYIIVQDGDFSTPQEVNGSPLIATDPVTRSMIVVRKYAVLTGSYTPLIYGAFSSIPDPVFTDCFLIEETPEQVDGPIMFFSRTYCQVPASRDEPLVYAFAMPGKSSVTLSELTGEAVNWRQYGNGSPYTRAILANVAYSYAIGDPGPDGSSLFTIPTLSRITYTSVTGPISVDYVGDVYEFAGSRAITAVIGGVTMLVGAEPAFVSVGSTDPATLPDPWIAEVNVRRWRGAIWEMSVITVPTS